MTVDTPGRIIAGKYELVSCAGEGGMAVVWKAVIRDAAGAGRAVAVKRLHPASDADPHFVKLFEEEARVGSHLRHPNIVQVLDFGLDEEGSYYLVMEWVEGLDMLQWIQSFSRAAERIAWPLVAAIGIEVCRALSAAHERVDERGVPAPVYHRDVSPSNVLLSMSGAVKLGDFGLARAMDRARMTDPNVIKGKLAYCAPELIKGGAPSPQTDLYALGVVLWEALAQRRLFTGKNDFDVLLAVVKNEIPRLETIRSDLPPSLTAAVHRALAFDPVARFMSATEMAQALTDVLGPERSRGTTELLGESVRAARIRLGKDRLERESKRAAGGAPGEQGPAAVGPGGPASEASVRELSLSDIEPLSDFVTPLPLVQRKKTTQ
jgi:serine/threonine-protein kinase